MTRTETDSFGPIEVPADHLWGAQTQRSLHFFAVSTEKMPWPVIEALVQVKRAAAKVNVTLAGLLPEISDAVIAACDEVLAGKFNDEFPLSVWQTGSGTQSNMNVNEVLANRASQRMGGVVGSGRKVHPNDDVNRSQSSNDVFPTAMQLALAIAIRREVLPALTALARDFDEKAKAHKDLLKIGRTHLQDATPMTLGQELSGWAEVLRIAERALLATLPALEAVPIGGTAVGTGLNSPVGYAQAMVEQLSTALRITVRQSPNRFASMGGLDATAQAHGALKGLAMGLFKIASDIRLLSSGPRAGLGELQLPENEPGSSIMPGKVNPTQCEMMTQVCAQVLGNDTAISMGVATGQLQLNVMRPMVIHAALQSCRLLAQGIESFLRHAVHDLTPNVARLSELMSRSLMLVTALTPHIGYDAAAAIAKKAHHEGLSLREAAVALGTVTGEQFDAWVRPEAMIEPLAPRS